MNHPTTTPLVSLHIFPTRQGSAAHEISKSFTLPISRHSQIFSGVIFTLVNFQKPDSCFRPEDTIDSNSKSSCRLRGSCCSGGDLACYGCNPVLLSKGIPCEQQTTDRQKAHARDCFCDKSCILFQARVSNQVKPTVIIRFLRVLSL